MKYDALHNRQFLEMMFNPSERDKSAIMNNDACMNVAKDSPRLGEPPELPQLRELYRLAKVLFEYVLWPVSLMVVS
jgi:hypothetical protein